MSNKSPTSPIPNICERQFVIASVLTLYNTQKFGDKQELCLETKAQPWLAGEVKQAFF